MIDSTQHKPANKKGLLFPPSKYINTDIQKHSFFKKYQKMKIYFLPSPYPLEILNICCYLVLIKLNCDSISKKTNFSGMQITSFYICFLNFHSNIMALPISLHFELVKLFPDTFCLFSKQSNELLKCFVSQLKLNTYSIFLPV